MPCTGNRACAMKSVTYSLMVLLCKDLSSNVHVQYTHNTCKAKRGRRPRVRNTPIDNTYVQVNNFLFTWPTNDLQKVVQHGAAQPQLNPVSMPIFVLSHKSRDTNSSRKNFPKLREWFLIHLFRIQILKNIFLNSLHAIRKKMDKSWTSFATCIKKAK